MIKQNTARPFLSARIDERFAAPLRNAAFARRTWFSVTLAAIVGVHLGVLALLLWHDRDQPTLAAKLEETPVEVVTAPPEAEQKPAAAQAVEKPATSAPRAMNDETVERKDADKETRAPKAPPAVAPPPPSTQQAKAEDAEAPKDAKADDKPDPTEAAKPETVEKDAEALDKAPPEPPKKPVALAKPKPVKTAQAKPHPPKTAAQHLAGTSDLPDYTFAAPMRKRAKVTGGTEDDRYLAQVFGLIMQNRRAIALPAGGEWFVSVAFQVDGGGNLVSLGIQHSSGYPPLDRAAAEAVEAAAPFPPPPSGATTGLVARLHSPTDARAAQLGN